MLIGARRGLFTVVLLVAGGLLIWGSNFADDYVGKELRSQNITFPAAEALTTEGRTDLAEFAGEQADHRRAGPGLRQLHQRPPGEGRRRADLRRPRRSAAGGHGRGASGQGARRSRRRRSTSCRPRPTTITDQRDTLFKGETLRGLLLSAYAWSTVGRDRRDRRLGRLRRRRGDDRAGGPRDHPRAADDHGRTRRRGRHGMTTRRRPNRCPGPAPGHRRVQT